MSFMKRVVILGSTGSIGQNALVIARHLHSHFEVVALAAKENIDLLEQQIHEFHPRLVAVFNEKKAHELQKRLPKQTILAGMEGLCAVAAYEESDLVISAIADTVGLKPTIEAIKAGKNIGLANKEVLVSAGAFVMQLAKEKGVVLIPIDSEHSAIFQCLKGERIPAARRLILTSSGGPFRSWTQEQIDQVTVEQALKHPNFLMGPKVTIDSSTLMNKGLEVIEAHWLFGMKLEGIEVLIHPQQKIHSMVEFVDGSIMAQMCEPDMLIPIQYAMTYPERFQGILPAYDFIKNSYLDFYQPDVSKFRCLDLAYEAIRRGGSLPCYMNAINAELVKLFLNRKIGWKEIGIQLERFMEQHSVQAINTLETILAIDEEARQEVAVSNLRTHL